jgi:trigger factor
VTDEDVEDEIKKMQDKNSRLVTVDEESANGDTVIIDFEGFLDGVPFEGGRGEAYSLALGSGTFIPGFEEQLIGKKNGEEVDVNVTFPENYQAETLAGKEALFKVKVHEVKQKELPEVDDEFAKDLGFDDIAALKDDVVAGLKATKETELQNAAEQKIISTLIENSPIDIPPQLLSERAESTRQNYEMRLTNSGIDPETYYKYMMQMSGSDDENYIENVFSQQALRELQTELIIDKIIDEEQIEVSDEELEKEYEKYAQTEGKSVEEFKMDSTIMQSAFLKIY